MEMFCERIGGVPLYLDSYFFLRDRIFHLLQSYSRRGWEQIGCERLERFFDSPFFQKHRIFFIRFPDRIETYVRVDTETEARSEILSAMNALERMAKKELNLYLFGGYDTERGANAYTSGILRMDGLLETCFTASFERRNEAYVVRMTYTDRIVFAVAAYFDDTGILPFSCCPHPIGGILLQEEKSGVREKGQELHRMFAPYRYFASEGENAGERYHLAESRGCQFIVEVNHRNAHRDWCRIKNVPCGTIEELPLHQAEDFILKERVKNEMRLYKVSLHRFRTFCEAAGTITEISQKSAEILPDVRKILLFSQDSDAAPYSFSVAAGGASGETPTGNR